MGMIEISVRGSFQPGDHKRFSAMQYGHADAVARAIEWLSSEVLPRAIRLDHELHTHGEKPEGPFGSKDTA
jgi:hypothetical protein